MRHIGVVSVRSIDVEPVYAITTSTRTFIADGIYHHNCITCNIWKHGNMTEYTLKMLDLHGREWIEEKKLLRHQTKKYKITDYQELEQTYKTKVKELQ